MRNRISGDYRGIFDEPDADDSQTGSSRSGAKAERLKLKEKRARTLSYVQRHRIRKACTKFLRQIKLIRKKERARTLTKQVLEPETPKTDGIRVSEKELVRANCKESFFEFVQEFWSTVIPEKPVWNWHIKMVCEQVQFMCERIFAGLPKLYDCVINIPPGTSKSTILSVMLPVWCWIRMPSFRFIGASYAETLALDLSLKSRDIVESDKFRECFPEIVLRPDQNVKSFFKNTAGGFRYAVGVNGSVTGLHAHLIVIDDPLDPLKSRSLADMKTANYWIDRQLSNRKVDKKVSAMILVMQRLHQDDPTNLFLKRKKVFHICLPAEVTPDIRPSVLKKNYKDGLMDPVRMDWGSLREEKAKGEDYYACTPGFTPILMANWKEKRIEDVEVGDEVVGYEFVRDGVRGQSGKERSGLVKSIVTRKDSWIREVVKITLESGRTVFCTPDHKWWTGFGPSKSEPHRKFYTPAALKGQGKYLFSVYEPITSPTPEQQRDFDWLGGMIDGEGGCKSGNLGICQSPTANPDIHRRIGKVLNRLGIPYTLTNGGSVYLLRGGRTTKIRLINFCRMVKAKQVAKNLWTYSGYISSGRDRPNGVNRSGKDRVVKIEPAGKMRVYGMETTSGNYVAWGYASQNSQFLQTPIPAEGAKFKTDRIKKGIPPESFSTLVRFWDKAGTQEGNGAFTVGTLLGLDYQGRFWVLDVVRGRWDSYEREKVIRKTADRDGFKVVVGVEQEPGSGGKESAENTLTRTLRGYRCKAIKVDKSTGGKEERADPWSVQVNGGKVYLPERLWNRERNGWDENDWGAEWVEEHRYFPHGRFKDQVDSAALAFSMCNKPRIRVGGINSYIQQPLNTFW